MMAVTKRKPSFSGVCVAFEKFKQIVPPTPLMPLQIAGKTIWCKCESLQPMGAFKLRGAWHRLTALSAEERTAGVVAFSSGNHAQGIAWAAARLSMPATIVMPTDAPHIKIAGTTRLGANIIFYDRLTESREEIALDIAQKKGAVLVPSFDDPWVIEGQGTAGLEALEQMHTEGLEAPNMIVTPCGGGGLAAGLALAISSACIVTVEPVGWDDMAVSLSSGKIIPVASYPPKTSCDALQTLRVSPLTFEILSTRNTLGVAVTEKEIFDAMRFAKATLNLVLEPSGAVALAAMLAGKVIPKERTLLMLSGGNVDHDLFDHVMAR